MSWADIRNKARQDVHTTFALACQYEAPHKAPRTISARLHTKLQTFGDLDREGYAQVVEDVNYVWLDDLDGPFVDKAVLTFTDSGAKYRITWLAPYTDGSGKRKAEVVPINGD